MRNNAMNFHAPIATPESTQTKATIGALKTDKRANFAPMPSSKRAWESCYSVVVNFDRLEPRACVGETLIFDAAQMPQRGDLVCVRAKDDQSVILIGKLVALGPKEYRLALSLDGSDAISGTFKGTEVHPAVALMSTRLDTPEGREAWRRNMAKRQTASA